MELRSGIYKGVHGLLPQHHRVQFEEGVNLLFSSWTALCLAIDNEWGGQSSRQKAEQLYRDVLDWFYGHTEHYADDLEVDLEAAMLQDFNTELQDDSPRQVSITLVSLHQECLQGNFSRIEYLKSRVVGNAHNLAKSQHESVDRDGTVMCGDDESSSSSDDDHDDENMAMDHDDQPPSAVPINLQSQQQAPVNQPIIDADGFETVQKPSRRRGTRTH